MSALKQLIDDNKLYFYKCLKIRDKAGNIVAFTTNEAQDRLLKIITDHEEKYPDENTRPTLYIIILKARQLGFSTATEGIFFKKLNFSFNKVAMIVSFDEDSAVTINDMSDRFFQYLPQFLKPKRRSSRGKGIIFENPFYKPDLPMSKDNDPGLQNKFLIETAKNLNAGSSYTINYLHISELAKWDKPEETMTSLMQSVPDHGAIVIVESTAKGMNYFQELWDNSEQKKNNFVPLFVAWFENPRYRATYTGFELTTYEQQINETYSLDNDQLQWRRNTIKDKLNGDENLFKQEYPCCAEEAFLTTGTPVFNNELVIMRKRLLQKKYEEKKPLRGTFTYDYKNEQIVDNTIKFVEDDNGPFILYESVDKRTPYVIGGDTAEGGADLSVGQVINNITGKQVAKWRMHIDTDLYAKQMYCMGKFFNTALTAIETNFDLHPVKELQRLGYYRQFRRETIDQITEERKEQFGFLTTRVTRPVIIDELVTIVREQIELINDIDTLDEMLVFVRNDKGRAEALQGKNDDCVIGLAIAYNARSQQSMVPFDDEPYESEYATGFGRTGY